MNNTSTERDPLISTGPLPNGSVVSYTITHKNCSNLTSRDRAEAKSTKKKLWFAVCLACCFFVTELVAGYFANSLGNLKKTSYCFVLLIYFFFFFFIVCSFDVRRVSFIIRCSQFCCGSCCHLFSRKTSYQE